MVSWVIAWKKGDIAIKFWRDDQWANILNIHCINHYLALACSITGDKLKFVRGFQLKMLQLWNFKFTKALKSLHKGCNANGGFWWSSKEWPKRLLKMNTEGFSDDTG